MDIDEKPLVVQLNWNKDDREGRFVLKNENDAVPPKVRAPCLLRSVGLGLTSADWVSGEGAGLPRGSSSSPAL